MAQTKTATRRTQEDRSDESRGKILAAAERAFASGGLAGARTDEIAAAAGVNKALLYYYFRSKEMLYEAVVEEHLREFNRRALEMLLADGPADKILMEYVDMHIDFISTRRRHAPLFQRVMAEGNTPARRLIQQYLVPRAEAMRKLLQRGMREGVLRKSDPFHTAVSIASLIVFYFSAAPTLQLIEKSDPYSPAALAKRKREVRQFLRRALFTKENEQ